MIARQAPAAARAPSYTTNIYERNLALTGAAPAAPAAPTPPKAEPAQADLPVATVVVDKAQLRTGPGKDNSPLMAVSKGTRLVIETRQGDWYRVVAPSGARAWVSSDIVAFGTSGTGLVGGYDGSLTK